MRYDTTLAAVFHPERQPPLDPALFAGKPDALCAELARLVYYAFPPDAARLNAALAALGLVDVRYFEDVHTHTQALTAADRTGARFISFRGTQSNAADILTDARFLRRPWDQGGSVHCGFARAYEGKNGALRLALRDWVGLTKQGNLYVTGHSLGGALASLFASDHPAAELVTIGAPSPGNAEFAALFAARKVRRYRQCSDLVTRISPEWFGYRQLPGLVYIDSSGHCCDPAPDAAAMAQDMAAGTRDYPRLKSGQPNSAPTRSLADHAPINYLSAMLGIRES
jgi:triacylglycerol lipase